MEPLLIGYASDPAGWLETLINDIDEMYELSASWLEEIASWMQSLIDRLLEIMGFASPLIIDLDNSGTIDLISLTNSVAIFDIDGDGYAEHTGWVGPADGLLVYDRNEDGIINDISELFGSVQEEGFIHLALLDSNADGVIDINDEKWSSLQIWVDANGDGFSQESELHTLDYFDIASISLTNIRVDQTVNGNIITNEGTILVQFAQIGDDGAGRRRHAKDDALIALSLGRYATFEPLCHLKVERP